MAASVSAFGIVAVAAVVSLELERQTLDSARRELSTVSRVTAERTSQTLSAADILARSIEDLAFRRSPMDESAFRAQAQTRQFYDSLANLQTLLPQIDVAALADSDGNMLASSRQFPAPVLNISRSDFFQALQKSPDAGLVLGKPVRSPATGQWMLYLARSFTDADGRFLGVAIVGIAANYFEGYFSTIDVGPTQAVSLLSDEGRLVARWPRIEKFIGVVLPGPGQLENKNGGKAFVDSVEGADGRERLSAVTPLQVQDVRMWASVTQTMTAILAPWWKTLGWIALFAGTSLVALGALTVFILRAIREEERWRRLVLERETRLSQQAVELKAARDLAETANRVRGEFLANMSHELRTPLNAVLGFSEILQQELFGPLGDPRYIEFSGDIHSSGQHLLDIINNILDLTKVDAGKLELFEQDVDIGELMQICARLVSDTARAGGVALDVRLPAEIIRLRGDSIRLKQILLNLLSNAVKFTPNGGRVTLSGERRGAQFILRVADTGIGMTPEESVKAMQPFRQIDNSYSRRYQGTGLGLPLTKSLVELHDGRMEIESAPGEGTTVTVYLGKLSIVGDTFAAA